MSDSEDMATTEVIVEKPKRERTPAQKAATAKALEALALRRAEKAAEKKAVVKRTTRTTTTVMKAKPTAKPPKNELVLERATHYIPEDDEEAHPYKEEPRPSKAKAVKSAITTTSRNNHPGPTPPAVSYDDDIRYLKEGLLGITGYIEQREERKALRKQKRKPVVSDSESTDTSEDDEPPAPRRKKRVAKEAPPTNQYNSTPDPQEVLRSIFWR